MCVSVCVCVCERESVWSPLIALCQTRSAHNTHLPAGRPSHMPGKMSANERTSERESVSVCV